MGGNATFGHGTSLCLLNFSLNTAFWLFEIFDQERLFVCFFPGENAFIYPRCLEFLSILYLIHRFVNTITSNGQMIVMPFTSRQFLVPLEQLKKMYA